MKHQTQLERALENMEITHSHNTQDQQVFNVSVSDMFEYRLLKRAIVRKVESGLFPELVIWSRIVYMKPHIEVKTHKTKKLFVITRNY